MPGRLRRLQSSLAIPALALLAGLALLVWEPVSLRVLRNLTFDQFQRLHPRSDISAPVRIIDIDDTSLQLLGQWPWPRARIAQMTTSLQRAGASAIVYDFLWSEPERSSVPGGADAPAPLASSDRQLIDAVGNGRVVLGFALQRNAARVAAPAAVAMPRTDPIVGGSAPAMRAGRARFVITGASPLPFLHDFDAAIDALAPLAAAADGYGALNFIADADGVIRRVPLLVRRGDVIVPTLVSEALRVADRSTNVAIRTSPHAGITGLRIGARDIDTSANGEIWIHYARPRPERTIAALTLLAGKVPDAQLQGRIVLVGTSAQGLMDVRFNPLGGVIPGVEVHAQMLEQILGGATLTRPGWANALEAVTIGVAGAAVGLVGLSFGALASLGFVLLMVLLIWSAAWLAFVHAGQLLDPASVTLAVLATFGAASVVRHVRSERRQRWVRAAFSRYISPNLVTYLMRNPDSLELSGRRQECSFVFTDLAGFTSMMEQKDPADAVALLNGYLDGMIAITFAHEGTLDRIVGDAVAVMFSAPVTKADHRRRALQCALAMQRFSAAYVARLAARGIAFGQTRIGVHTGFVIVGNFGSSSMFDYRALGDVVNTAARLEGANKHLGTSMCVSQATLTEDGEVLTRPIGRLLMQGKTVPLAVFEPIDPLLGKSADVAYRVAYELMATHDPQAVDAFARLHETRPDDPLVRLHHRRLQLAGCACGDLIMLDSK